MDLKSIVLAAGLAVGYAAPAEAVKITKIGEERTHVTFGHDALFDIYRITVE